MEKQIKRFSTVILRLIVGIIICSMINSVNAQIGINVKAAHKILLQHEAAKVFITIYNDTKETLIINKEYGNFTLTPYMVGENMEPLSIINTNPICSDLLVRAGQKEQIIVDISKWYNMLKVQNYKLTIYGSWQDSKFKSNPVDMSVVNGFVMKSVDKTLSGTSKKMLHYELRYWSREGSEHVFLRVDEPAASLNYGVFDLGRIIRFFKPILQVDLDGNIKIVHQVGPDCYKKSIFKVSEDGVVFVDQSYHLENGAPYPFLKKLNQ